MTDTTIHTRQNDLGAFKACVAATSPLAS